MNKKSSRFPIHLFCSLMLLGFIPFLHTLVRTNFIANIPNTDGLGIAGHMEWFDLMNETIQSFLIVNIIYISFSMIVFIHCNAIVSAMAPDHIHAVTTYLQLETIGFIAANMVSFVNVLFVVLAKPFYLYIMVILKTIFTIIGDLCLIPKSGINGAAYSNIAVNCVCTALCLIVVFRERLLAVSFRPDKAFIKDYLFIGSFSGFQILLDNIVYSSVVCKMVNETAEQGNYWTANNIMWGLLLIPISALAEIIKKDCGDKLTRVKMKQYHAVIIITFLIWLCLIPVLNPFLKNIMGLEHPETVRHILVVLIPFYLAYSYTVLFDNILIGYGKTHFCFVISVIVNLIYYPIVYGLTVKGVFTPGITFLCMMFGFGMVTHFCCSILCFAAYKRHL